MSDVNWPHLKGRGLPAGMRGLSVESSLREHAGFVVCPAQRGLALLEWLPPHTLLTALLTWEGSRDPVLYFHFLIHRSCTILFILATGSPLWGLHKFIRTENGFRFP